MCNMDVCIKECLVTSVFCVQSRVSFFSCILEERELNWLTLVENKIILIHWRNYFIGIFLIVVELWGLARKHVVNFFIYKIVSVNID